ncbi:hypothetical protein BGW41_008309 [Actinomortierella wolfii]|nr:hypothetical protein BGW41_008309 [Actinomortierella wolfii]
MSEHLAQLSGDIASFSLMDVDINSLAEMVALHHGSQRSSNGRLKALQLQLGIMLTPETFACKITCSENVCMTFLENRRMIRIQFRREYETGTVEYQMELKVQDLESGCITIDEDCKSDGNNCSNFNRNSCSSNSHNNSDSKSENATTWVTIRMKIPPTYWRFTRTPPSPDDPSRGGGFNMQNLRRAIDLRAIISSTAVNKSGAPAMSGEPAQPDPPSQKVKLGKWLVVRLEVDLRQNRRSLNSFLKKAREFNLYSSPAAAKHQKITAVVDHTQQQKSSWQDFGIRLRFDVQFMLESVLSHNFILADNVTREFVSLLSTIEPIKACTILENVIGRRTRIWDPFAFLSNEVKRLSGVPIYPRIVPHHNVLLRKVIITPTTMYLLPPTIETSNRIIRKFQEYEDYFLRVEFSDEGPDKIWARGGQVNNALFNRIYATLVNGVKIGERLYEFLAFSSSQLRENAAWFFCSNGDKNPTPDEIRNWMGDFSRIKSIAKYGARMGQCFSSTRPIIELSAEQVKVIDDIEHDGSNFSDGCGMISAALAEFIQNRLDKEVAPSAFQIRLGGSKGVLAVAAQDPERKSPNTDFWVAIRPSMNKFDSNHYVLEVIKTSSFIPSYLNRQIIVLLSALGVPDKVFLDYKDQMVREYDQMETNDIIAYRILAQQWDESGTYRMMSAMIKAGFLKSGDIFLKNLIKLCKHQMLEDLAKRARIFIPDGAFLLGVVDETGTLEENEIFVQVSSIESPNKRRIIEQDCVVVRSPCFHPGDVRVVRAVNNPRLHHLHDVVVFNTKGRRSLPNMCSGGDLDGDEFTIIWDSTIVQCVRQEAPMDYKGQDTLIKDDITIRDVQSFFVQHAVSNNLGIIANAHLSFSDQLPMGPFDGKCLRLAQLHSDAVDFPKTGKPAEIKEELRPKKYPDFMGKSRDRSYRSERILGKLYRDCSNHESFDPLQESLKIDERLLVDGYTEYLEEARALKERHDNEIRSLTNHYGVRSDVEVVSGFITEMDSRSNKREYENRQSIARAYSAIRKTFRQIFDEEFHHKDPIASSPSHPNSLQQRQEQKASACREKISPVDIITKVPPTPTSPYYTALHSYTRLQERSPS